MREGGKIRGNEGRRERGEETGRVYKMEGGGNKRKEEDRG